MEEAKLFKLIEDFDQDSNRHRQEVEKLIKRQATTRKVAQHFRLHVLKRQLQSGRRISPNHKHNAFRHLEPDLVQLAVSAAKALTLSKNPTRPKQRKSKNPRRFRNHKHEVKMQDVDPEINAIARSFHPLLHVHGNRNSVKEGIHVTEGGACDFYSIKLTRRPSAVVHLTIQDQHLQTIIEPKVLRFTERDWATAQLVCVSAIDDTDKSSESVETTMLEHVTASSDAQYNNLRFEVPVSISDNDGHYLWGFGSNHYRQFGVDEIGPGASLPAPISCHLRMGKTKLEDAKKDKDSDESNSSGNESDGSEDPADTSNDNSNGNDNGNKRNTRKSNQHSFVANAKPNKPSMLFSSVAAGRFTTCATQTNGKTTEHGRLDGTLWYNSCKYNPELALSRRIGTRKTFIISVSAGSNHCMALDTNGMLMGWGSNIHGQLGIEDKDIKSIEHPILVSGLLKRTIVNQVSCGDSHTGCIDAEGNLYLWGCSRTGALGLHDKQGFTSDQKKTSKQKHPIYIPGLSDSPERGTLSYRSAKNTGDDCTDENTNTNEANTSASIVVALETTTISSGTSTRVGSDRFSPELAILPTNAGLPFFINCGWGHTAVLAGEGKLYTCGYSGSGRLGRSIPGKHSGFYKTADPVFRRVEFHAARTLLLKSKRNGNSNNNSNTNHFLVVSVACGRSHTLALDSERELWTWGGNDHGQLGLGHRVSQATPRLVKLLRPFSRDAESSKQRKSRLQKNNTSTNNTNTTINNETNSEDNNPYPPQNKKEPKHDLLAAISCGDSHSCVITEKGLLYVFGNNESEQLGLGEGCVADEVFPRLHHPTLSLDVRQVSCGANHTLVVTGECPKRVYHAQSTFDDIMNKHKALVRRDQKRRRRFTRMVTKAEAKRKQMNWRRPVALLIPSTKKAHSRTMSIHKKLVEDHQQSFSAYQINSERKKKARPSSAVYGTRSKRWENGASFRKPIVEELARFPNKKQVQRPKSANNVRRRRRKY